MKGDTYALQLLTCCDASGETGFYRNSIQNLECGVPVQQSVVGPAVQRGIMESDHHDFHTTLALASPCILMERHGLPCLTVVSADGALMGMYVIVPSQVASNETMQVTNKQD